MMKGLLILLLLVLQCSSLFAKEWQRPEDATMGASSYSGKYYALGISQQEAINVVMQYSGGGRLLSIQEYTHSFKAKVLTVDGDVRSFYIDKKTGHVQ